MKKKAKKKGTIGFPYIHYDYNFDSGIAGLPSAVREKTYQDMKDGVARLDEAIKYFTHYHK